MKDIVILSLHLGTGGIENAISSISNILCEKYNVKIISTYKLQDKPAFYLNPKIKVEYLIEDSPNKQEIINAIKNIKIFSILKEGYKAIKLLYLKKSLMIKSIKNIDADIVISTRDIHNKWLGKYGKNSIIKIATEHNHHNNDEKYIKKIVNSVKNIDYFMPTSEELAKFYKEKLKNTNTKVKFIRNSISYYPSIISDLNNKNILSVGRLSPEKGYKDLIEVFEKVLKFHTDWKLNIVGNGPQYDELKEIINSKKLQNSIKLLGFKSIKELEKIQLNSSIYVMTSYTESFGLVLIEAESYGLPIVVFDSAQGAHEIVVNKQNGYFVENRNKDEMAKRIVELIESKDLRKKMGQEGRKLSQNYKKEVVSKLWYSFINSCKKQT